MLAGRHVLAKPHCTAPDPAQAFLEGRPHKHNSIETADAVPACEIHPMLGLLLDIDCQIFYFFNMTPMEGLTERTIGFEPDEPFLKNAFNGPRPSWTRCSIIIDTCCETLERDTKVKREGGVTWGHLAAELPWVLSLDLDLGPEGLLFHFKISNVYLLQEGQPRRQEAKTCRHMSMVRSSIDSTWHCKLSARHL
ncbi:hypothetical protein KVT40_001491 [Elsinoe batatas]|uniref:Uncharacterized protein n=1 Tax=Elsinoe batatas TaxID=2601811 RepID=A0A8K0L624_9PEZI|nr:hypothetical protein KVT40_001491 [Elsinoe batatas]